MSKSAVAIGAVCAFGILASILTTKPAISDNPHNGALIWKDGDGRPVKVVAVDEGSPVNFLIADGSGAVWRYNPGGISPITEPVAAAVVFFASSDCTGAGYLNAPDVQPRWVVRTTVTAAGEYRVVPDRRTGTPLVALSFVVNGTCTQIGEFQTQGIALSTTRTTTLPTQLVNGPPHPEFADL